MVSKKAILLWLFFLGIGMAQTTLCEAACELPVITGPVSASAVLGDNVTFTVTATADNLTYQWKKDTDVVIVGATDASYDITGVTVDDRGEYTCTVTSCGTHEATSDSAILTVMLALTVTSDLTGDADEGSAVTSEPSGINCSPLDSCEAYYEYGTEVTLTGAPSPRAIFDGWTAGECSGSSDPCVVTMDQDRDTTAKFTLVAGTLEGTVVDSNLDPVAGVLITADDGLAYTLIDPSTTTDGNGYYSFPDIYTGSYTVTANKYKYKIQSFTGVDVTQGDTTTRDFQLVDAEIFTFSGTVTDYETTWPLYAEITYEYGFDVNWRGTGWTDPATGEFSIDIAEGTYSVFVSVPGYITQNVLVDLTTSAATQDFQLRPDMRFPPLKTTCTALGYHWEGVALTEDFNSCAPPAGWDITPDPDGAECHWEVNEPDPDAIPYTGDGDANNTGGTGCFADADGLACGLGTVMETVMITPLIDCSQLGAPVHLRFKTDFDTVNANPKPAAIRVDISYDGGGTWTGGDTSFWFRQTNQKGPFIVDDTLGAFAIGNPNVKIRFTYTSDGAEPSWAQIDDVKVYNPTCVIPETGGIVVGNVYDANTNEGLNGALVEEDNSVEGNSVFTVATPGDNNLDDGFYSMYLTTAGTVALTASMVKYGPETENPSVPLLDRVRQDFYLSGARLSAEPNPVEVYIGEGTTLDMPLSVYNSGGVSAYFELFERYYPAPAAPGPTQQPPLTALEESAFAMDIIAENMVIFPEVGTPGTMDVIGTTTVYAAGDFLEDNFSQMYVLSDNKLYLVSTADGSASRVHDTQTTQPLTPGEVWTGMTGTVDGSNILYAVGSNCGTTSTLYTIDTTTAVVTEVFSLLNGLCVMDIAINAAGEMYGVDIGDGENDNLIGINLTLNTDSTIGTGLGIDASLGQGLDFDASGDLYWASYNEITGGDGELRTIDTTAGTSDSIEAFPEGTHIDCLAFTGTYLGEIPWLDENPTEDTVEATSTLPVTLTFNSGVFPAGTIEEGFLSVTNTTPYGSFNIPVTMIVMGDQPLHVDREFTGLAAGTVTSVPAGIDCGLDCDEDYTYGEQLTLTAAATEGSFLGWSGGCTGTDAECSITMDQSQDVVAFFSDPGPSAQDLGVGITGSGTGSVESTPAGITCDTAGTDCLATFTEGVSVNLVATADIGSTFMGWTGDCSGNTTCVVTMDQARYVAATFTDDSTSNMLTVNVAGNGSGGVSSAPVGIFCGTAGSTCAAPFDDRVTVTLTAVAAPGTTFIGWTEACLSSGTNLTCDLTMNEAKNVTATFTLDAFALTVTKNGQGDGTVTSNPAGIDCGGDCTESYNYGSQVILTAIPNQGSKVTVWQGKCNEPVSKPPSPTCTVDIHQAEDITVSFEPAAFPWTMFMPAITGMGKE